MKGISGPQRFGRRDRRGLPGMPSVSPVIIDSLRRRLDRVARQMAIEMARAIPFSEGMGGGSAFGSEVLAACREGVGTLLSLWEESRPPSSSELQQLSRMGGRLASTGVPLDAILRAYRVAALVIWQQVIELVRIHPEIEAHSVLTAVGPLFDYLDAISVAVSTSYLETREQARREQDRQYDQFFSEVLGGTADPEMVARAAEGGTVLEFPYRLVAVAADDPTAEATVATAWLVVGAHVALFQSNVVALVPGPVKMTSLHRLLRVAGGGDRVPWAVACGPMAADLAAVPAAVRSARDALVVGQILAPEESMYFASQLHPYLAWLHDLPGLREFVEVTLGPLLERERTRRLPLRETLEALLDHEGLSAAARSLGVHRHTLLYRTERITELVGGWSRSEERVRLELALRGSRLLDALEPSPPTELRASQGNGRPRRVMIGR